MAKSESRARVMNLLYGMGASVVIMGALFKIMHWSGANLMLIVGLVTEAVIFFVSAFDVPAKEHDWTLVYPELSGQDVEYDYEDEYLEQEGTRDPIAEKIDELFASAKIDSGLLLNLSNSMRNLESAAKDIGEMVDSSSYTQDYNEELSLATERIRSLNDFYKSQLEGIQAQTTMNSQIVDVTNKVKDQMEDLAENISSLNVVYGGMLSAMKK